MTQKPFARRWSFAAAAMHGGRRMTDINTIINALMQPDEQVALAALEKAMFSPEEANWVMCPVSHTAAPCEKCGWPGDTR